MTLVTSQGQYTKDPAAQIYMTWPDVRYVTLQPG